jgi:hypothetical protein
LQLAGKASGEAHQFLQLDGTTRSFETEEAESVSFTEEDLPPSVTSSYSGTTIPLWIMML